MNRIKLFEEYSEKLWFHIDDDDSTYCDDPCTNFNRELASKILSSLSNDWAGKLVDELMTFIERLKTEDLSNIK